MVSIRLNEWRKLTYYDPAVVLGELRRVEESDAHRVADGRVRRLRTGKQKGLREGRDAALFAYGMGVAVLETSVCFARHESADYDVVLKWFADGVERYCPVQLKEVPPEDINPTLTLTDIVAGLRKYTCSEDLAVAVKLGRLVNGLSGLPDCARGLSIRELWFFGATTPSQSKWVLYGDVLSQPSIYRFDYPRVIVP